jgi:hypothetical protein
MATTTKTHSVNLSTVEAGAILKRALSACFDKNAAVSVEFVLGTKYDNPGDREGYEAVTKVTLTGTTEEKTELPA